MKYNLGNDLLVCSEDSGHVQASAPVTWTERVETAPGYIVASQDTSKPWGVPSQTRYALSHMTQTYELSFLGGGIWRRTAWRQRCGRQSSQHSAHFFNIVWACVLWLVFLSRSLFLSPRFCLVGTTLFLSTHFYLVFTCPPPLLSRFFCLSRWRDWSCCVHAFAMSPFFLYQIPLNTAHCRSFPPPLRTQHIVCLGGPGGLLSSSYLLAEAICKWLPFDLWCSD